VIKNATALGAALVMFESLGCKHPELNLGLTEIVNLKIDRFISKIQKSSITKGKIKFPFIQGKICYVKYLSKRINYSSDIIRENRLS